MARLDPNEKTDLQAWLKMVAVLQHGSRCVLFHASRQFALLSCSVIERGRYGLAVSIPP